MGSKVKRGPKYAYLCLLKKLGSFDTAKQSSLTIPFHFLSKLNRFYTSWISYIQFDSVWLTLEKLNQFCQIIGQVYSNLNKFDPIGTSLILIQYEEVWSNQDIYDSIQIGVNLWQENSQKTQKVFLRDVKDSI